MTKTTKVPFKCPVCEGKGCKTCNNTGIVWGEQTETEKKPPQTLGNAIQEWVVMKSTGYGTLLTPNPTINPYTKPLCNPFNNPFDIWY